VLRRNSTDRQEETFRLANPDLNLCKTEWVLRSGYGFSSNQIASGLSAIAGQPGVTVEAPLLLATGIDWMGGGLEFGDALHLAKAEGLRLPQLRQETGQSGQRAFNRYGPGGRREALRIADRAGGCRTLLAGCQKPAYITDRR